jgi:hypothetical protein
VDIFQTAPREAGLLPWSIIAVDMIGPTLKVGDRTEKLRALTIIDLVIHLIEIVRVNNTTSATVTRVMRYPKPVSCIHDPGSEFLEWNFPEMCTADFLSRCTTTKKSTSKRDLRTDAPMYPSATA